jgi:hypothetical protein
MSILRQRVGGNCVRDTLRLRQPGAASNNRQGQQDVSDTIET